MHEQAIILSMSTGASDERPRSPLFRLGDWADWVEFEGGRRWDREDAVTTIKRNEAIETVSSVFMVASMKKSQERFGDPEYRRKLIVEDVAFLTGDEAIQWAKEYVDGEWEVVEVSLKGQL